jgi:sugar lactone lactonase YvrE
VTRAAALRLPLPAALFRPATLRAALVLLLAASAGCGDAILFLGDSPARMRLVAGVPGERGSVVGTDGLDSRLQGVQGVAVAADGSVYQADASPARILRLRRDGTLDLLYDLRDCPSSCIRAPGDLALDLEGRLLIADAAARRVWRMDGVGGAYEPYAGDGSASDAPDGTARLEGGLLNPTGVAVAPDGTVYIADGGARRVRSVSTDGVLGTVAGTGDAGDDGDGGPARDARFQRPVRLALLDGVLFVSDSASHRVRAITLGAGTIEGVAGSGAPGFFGDGGPAEAARLRAPVGIALADDGATLYVADRANHRVRVIDRASGIIHTFAGDGGTEFTGDGGAAGSTSLAAPTAVSIRSGVLFVTDAGLYVVWRTEIPEAPELLT